MDAGHRQPGGLARLDHPVRQRRRHAGRQPPRDGTLHYGRNGTPTTWALCEALTEMEPGAAMTRLYPSGSGGGGRGAARRCLQAGDELLMVDSAYGPTRALCDSVLKRFGVTTRYYDPMVGAGIAELIGEKTRAIFMESPGTHSFEVQDVPGDLRGGEGAGARHPARQHLGDAALLPGVAAGVDLSILACTKYVGGHADLMLGSVTVDRGGRGPAGEDAAGARPDRRAGRRLAGAARPQDARRAAPAAPGERAQGRALAAGAAAGRARPPSRFAGLPRATSIGSAISAARPGCSRSCSTATMRRAPG